MSHMLMLTCCVQDVRGHEDGSGIQGSGIRSEHVREVIKTNSTLLITTRLL